MSFYSPHNFAEIRKQDKKKTIMVNFSKQVKKVFLEDLVAIENNT